MTYEALIPLIDPFLDEATPPNAWGHIQIFQPGGTKSDEEIQVALDSEDFTAYLAMLLREENGRTPTPKQVEDARRVVRGHALERPRRKPRQGKRDSLPKLPVLGQVLLEFIKQQKEIEAPSARWVQFLAGMARQMGLDTSTVSGWPKNAIALGHQFADLKETIQPYGVTLQPKNTNLRLWKVEYKELPPPPPPPKEEGQENVTPQSGETTQGMQFTEVVQKMTPEQQAWVMQWYNQVSEELRQGTPSDTAQFQPS